MIVFYDPATGQVMAIYSGGTNSKAWEEQGCLRASVPPNLESQVTRDHTVKITDDEVTSIAPQVNPTQPPPEPGGDARQAQRDRIQELRAIGRSAWTVAQLRELIELLAEPYVS